VGVSSSFGDTAQCPNTRFACAPRDFAPTFAQNVATHRVRARPEAAARPSATQHFAKRKHHASVPSLDAPDPPRLLAPKGTREHPNCVSHYFFRVPYAPSSVVAAAVLPLAPEGLPTKGSALPLRALPATRTSPPPLMPGQRLMTTSTFAVLSRCTQPLGKPRL